MNGGAVERVGSLLHQAARDPVGLGLGLGLQLRLLLLSLPRRVLMVCLDRRFEDILEGYATACVSAIDFIVDFLFFFWLSFALRSSEIARGFRKVSFHGCFICLKKWSKISNKVHCSLMERNLAEYGSDRSVWKENVYFHIFVSNVTFYYSNVWCQVCQQTI